MPLDYEIISTGSQGNAVIVGKEILVDCGVPYKQIAGYVRDIKLVLLTHIHGDHFRASTIRRLAEDRPTLRFGCGKWLVSPLLSAGVRATNIDPMEIWTMYDYGRFQISPVPLSHDVPNCGWKIHLPDGKALYATDTNNLNGISAKNYDLYLIEANFEDEEIRQRIAEKKEAGEFAYEKRVLQYHLSKSKCDDFIYQNIGPNGVYVHLHGHVDKPETEDNTKGDFTNA